MKNEKHTLEDLEYGKKHCKTWKMRMHSVGPEIWGEKLKNVENEKFKLQDLKHDGETLKNVENENCTLYDLEYGEKKKLTKVEKDICTLYDHEDGQKY